MIEISYRTAGYAIGAMAVEIAKLRKLDFYDDNILNKIVNEFEAKAENFYKEKGRRSNE